MAEGLYLRQRGFQFPHFPVPPMIAALIDQGAGGGQVTAGFIKTLRILSGAALRRSRRTHRQIQPRITEVAVGFMEVYATSHGEGVGLIQIELRFGRGTREAVILRSRHESTRQVILSSSLPQTVYGKSEVC